MENFLWVLHRAEFFKAFSKLSFPQSLSLSQDFVTTIQDIFVQSVTSVILDLWKLYHLEL